MTREKKKKLNGEENQKQQNNKQHKISTQEEITRTLTSKQNPRSISPPEHQPQSKMANLINTTPKPITNDDSISSTDSQRLAIDESKQLTDETKDNLIPPM